MLFLLCTLHLFSGSVRVNCVWPMLFVVSVATVLRLRHTERHTQHTHTGPTHSLTHTRLGHTARQNSREFYSMRSLYFLHSLNVYAVSWKIAVRSLYLSFSSFLSSVDGSNLTHIYYIYNIIYLCMAYKRASTIRCCTRMRVYTKKRQYEHRAHSTHIPANMKLQNRTT